MACEHMHMIKDPEKKQWQGNRWGLTRSRPAGVSRRSSVSHLNFPTTAAPQSPHYSTSFHYLTSPTEVHSIPLKVKVRFIGSGPS